MFLSSPSLRSFSSQECSFPQESYLLFLFLSPTPSLSLSYSLTFQSLFPPPDLFSFQPSLRDSVRCTRSPLCHPLLPFSLTCSIFFTLLRDSFFLSPTVSRPRSLSYSPFSTRGEQKLRIREAFVESHSSIEGFHPAVLSRQPSRFNHSENV